MGTKKCSRAFLTVIFICFSICISSEEFNQNQCQDCNHNGKSNACDIYKNTLKLKNCTTFKNQVNKTVAKKITNLRLLYFESEIVLPENLQEEFPNLIALEIFGGKPVIETNEVNHQHWPNKLTTLKIHNIEDPLSLPNFANSNIKILDFNDCDNLINISNISSLKKLEYLEFYHVEGLNSIPSGIFKENGKLNELIISSSFRRTALVLTEDSFEGLTNLQSLEVVESKSNFEITKPPHLFKHCSNLQNITWKLTSNVTFPKHFFPPTLQKFHLCQYAQCTSMNHLEFSLESFDNVTKENLKELKIACTNHGYDDLIGNLASKFVNLEYLELNNNNITILKNSRDIPETVKHLDLKNNPLVCDCRTNQSIADLELRFKNSNESPFQYNNGNETCSPNFEPLCLLTPANVASVTAPVIIAVIFVSLCVYRKRKHQRHHPTFPSDSDLTYDAFIISHDKDKDILINLLTELNSNYNIVTPHDYLLGIQEFENLLKHISCSKRIIIILSENFFSSSNETLDLKSCLDEALANYSKR